MQRRDTSLDSQIASLQASLTELGIDKVVVEDACFRCGHSRNHADQACPNCSQLFWTEWDPNWYKHRLVNISLGHHRLARKASDLLALGCIAGLLIAALATRVSQPSLALIFSGLLIGSGAVYDIWAYCHGRTTSIDSLFHDATPRNTHIRTFGLLLDFLFLALAFHLLARV